MNSNPNFISEGLDRGLTVKEELFCQAISQGANVCEAERAGGYVDENTTYLSSIGSRKLKKPHIRARVQELINNGSYLNLVRDHWQEVLSAKPPDDLPEKDKWSIKFKQWEAKDRVIGEIARLGDWTPEKTETKKKLIVTGKLSDILPD